MKQAVREGDTLEVYVPHGRSLHEGWWEAIVAGEGGGDGNSGRCNVPGEALELCDEQV